MPTTFHTNINVEFQFIRFCYTKFSHHWFWYCTVRSRRVWKHTFSSRLRRWEIAIASSHVENCLYFYDGRILSQWNKCSFYFIGNCFDACWFVSENVAKRKTYIDVHKTYSGDGGDSFRSCFRFYNIICARFSFPNIIYTHLLHASFPLTTYHIHS